MWDASSQTWSPSRYRSVMVSPCLAVQLIAQIACCHRSIITLMCSSVSSLLVWMVSDGPISGSYLRRISFGDRLVVLFLRLLCTSVTSSSHWVQSSGAMEVTRRRYCSTHWFFLSDIPSVWGWNAEDRFCLIPSFWVRARPKWEVNRGSQLLIILVGVPNHLYMCLRYSWVMPTPVMLILQGINTAVQEHLWSTMVRMASFPQCLGRPVIRSIAICWNGHAPGMVVI
jgi:hypothetical protein